MKVAYIKMCMSPYRGFPCRFLLLKVTRYSVVHSFIQALVRELDYKAEVHRVCEIKRLQSALKLKAKKKAYNLEVDPFWNRFTRWDDLPICLAPLGNSSGELRSTSSPV